MLRAWTARPATTAATDSARPATCRITAGRTAESARGLLRNATTAGACSASPIRSAQMARLRHPQRQVRNRAAVQPATTSARCRGSAIWTTNRCQNPPIPCTTDEMSDGSHLPGFHGQQGLLRPVTMCNSDSDCLRRLLLRSGGSHLQAASERHHYVGGQAGCSMSGPGRQAARRRE